MKIEITMPERYKNYMIVGVAIEVSNGVMSRAVFLPLLLRRERGSLRSCIAPRSTRGMRPFRPHRWTSRDNPLGCLERPRRDRLRHDDESIRAPETFWGRAAENELIWFKPWTKVLQWKEPFAKWFAGAVAFQLLVGVYGGYFGAGIGILMLAAFSILGLTNIHQMNGFKNLLGGAINALAIVYFISQKMVYWPDVGVMAAGAITGGYLGAGVARKIGQKAVRRLVVVIGFGMALSLLLKR